MDEHDNRQRGAPDRRIALLIDADNVSHVHIAAMLAELSRHGTANIRRAYGNWAAPGLKGWTAKLHEFAIRPIQQFSYSAGKNATDIALVIDAMELLYTQKPDAFCIASSDADFTPLVMQLKANGHDVYGFGARKTPAPFVAACTTFLFLDGVAVADHVDAADAPAKAGKATSRPPARNKEGAAAGRAAKRQAPIDPRNYGVKNFPALFAATGLFDIVKIDGGQSFVADKGNKDRTGQPKI